MLALLLLVAGSVAATAAPPLAGAVFTTDFTCTGVDLNIYGNKDDVYINGGPSHPGAAALPDGSYYVQVTEPDGALLGTSLTTANPAPVSITNGVWAQCYQLSAILNRATDGLPGYDDTTNPGGEYKVWVSNESSFVNNSTKTDNFKVKTKTCDDCPPPQGHLTVEKFYDANANGTNDDAQLITGWQVQIDDANHTGYHSVRYTPVDIILDPGAYVVAESTPVETNWIHTTATLVPAVIEDGQTTDVQFGNLCVGAGGGLTLGFWSNKNGSGVMTRGGMATELAFLSSLNLRKASGDDFDPATYASFRTWILNATATNMAYMLSAQLAAMELNVYNGFVNGGSLVYAPGATSANGLGFASVGALMNEANAELGLHGVALDGSPYRSYQEALKNALDNANNNRNFVQGAPCAFSFAQ